jgi:hypothetical protein
MTDENAHADRETRAVLERAGRGWKQLLPVVEEAVLDLPELEEQVLHLSIFQSLDDASIAELLELSGGERQVSEVRDDALTRLHRSEWASGLSRLELEGVVRCAGEAWRVAGAAPLPETAQRAARQAMMRAVTDAEAHGRASVPSGVRRDRPVRRSAGRISPVRVSALVLGGVIAVLCTLWVLGLSARPDTYALASIAEYDEVLQTTVRGAEEANAANPSFAAGASALLEAPVSTMGFFPRYDEDRAARAIQHLERSFHSSDDAFLRARAAFFLAKAHLMREETAEAERWLERVNEQNAAAYRDDAASLLQSLRSR